MATLFRAAAIAATLVSLADAAAGASLCETQEKTIFSCILKGSARKEVALCASKDLSAKRGRLVYRFGKPDRIELVMTQDLAKDQKNFSYSHYFRARFDETKIVFSNNGYEYSIRESHDAEEKPDRSAGVDVSAPGGKFQTLDCVSPWASKLPTLENVLPKACDDGDC